MLRLFVSAFLLSTTAALAQELPEPDSLAERLAQDLPNYWSMADFRVVASAQTGDPVSPRALIRFEADTSPRADLFASTGERIGPFEIIVKTVEATASRTLYGTLQLDYSAGAWDGPTTLENPVANLGQPSELFTSPVLEMGSLRHQETVTMLREDSIEALRATIEAELRQIAAEGAARSDALRAETDEETRRLQAEHTARLDEARSAHAAALAALNEQHRQDVEELQARLAPEIASLEERLAIEADEYDTALAAQKETLLAAHEAEIAEIAASHAAAIGELRARQAAELAEAETGFTLLRERLDRQIAEADDLIFKQEAVIARTEEISANQSSIEAESARLVEQQRTVLATLLGTWRGEIDCPDASYGVTIDVTDQSGKTMFINYTDTRGGYTYEATLATNSLDFARPIEFVYSTPDDRGAILENGQKLTYDANGQLSYGGDDQQCAFLLSRG